MNFKLLPRWHCLRRHWAGGGREHQSSSSPFFGAKSFALRIIGVDEREGVDKTSDKKWHKKEGVQPRKWCFPHKFFYAPFCVTQFFHVGFSWSSDSITAYEKKNTSKSLWPSFSLRPSLSGIKLISKFVVFHIQFPEAIC